MADFFWPPAGSSSSGPIEFILDGLATQVSEDTAVPANSIALPVKVIDGAGVLIDFATDTTQSANEALLTTIDSTLSSIDNSTASIDTKLPSTLGQKTSANSLAVVISSDQSAVAISAASLPLPAGAATEATLASIDTTLSTGVTVTATNLDIRDLTSVSDSVAAVQSGAWSVSVSNFPGTQPVSGTVTANQGTSPWIVDGSGVTQPISAASLPLPTGAATETTLASIDSTLSGGITVSATNLDIRDLSSATDSVAAVQSGAWLARVQDGTGNSIGSTAGALDVNIQNASIAVTSAVPAAVTVKQAAISVGTSAVRLTTDGSAPSATRTRLKFMPSADSTGAFYFGSSSVTSSGATRGVQVFPGASEDFTDDANDYYIISDTAAQTVFVVECE